MEFAPVCPSFLVGLTRLKFLYLHNVLDARTCTKAMKYIALLSELTELHLSQNCKFPFRGPCWADASAVPLGPMLEGREVYLTSAQFRPLFALRRLEVLTATGQWKVRDADELDEALQGMRHRMGVPPVYCEFEE